MITVFSWRDAIRRSTLAAPTKHVLLNLSLYMNDTGEGCFPSLKKQAEDTSLSERTVCTHLQLAEDAGFLFKSKHGFKGRQWKRNEYVAIFPITSVLKTEADARADEHSERGTESLSVNARGTESNDSEALKEVPTNSPLNSPKVKINKKKPRTLVSIDEWETKVGSPLCLQQMQSWVKAKNYNPDLVKEMIEEFRTRMRASDNRYADYRAAFQDWLNRGFLSKKPADMVNTLTAKAQGKEWVSI